MHIKPIQDSVGSVVGIGLLGLFYSGLGAYGFTKNPLAGLIVIAVSLRLTLYQAIDLCFTKTIVRKNDGQVLLRVAGFYFHLNPRRSFLRIEEMTIPARQYAQPTTLNIYRNSSNRLSRLFKNKIRLSVVTPDNIKSIEALALNIQKEYKIQFMDVFKFE